MTFIKKAEEKYASVLEERCRSLFSKVNIPSHNDIHHARVWSYAREILRALDNAGLIEDQFIAEKAIIAVWFHDTGLTINKGPDHGSQSRVICRDFLVSQHISPDLYADILDAVEKHDDKSYGYEADPASLTSIVSVADDMDAFGYIGILRYAEIYSMRNIPLHEMSEIVISNAQARFNHLKTTYHIFPDLVDRHEKRLAILVDFFRSLKEETLRI